MFKKVSKSGTAMTEIAIGIALAAVAIAVGMGLFNDNLAGMVTNSNLSNFFGGNDSKTEFSAFNRDYSNSQISVQIMGEQGLQMLRRTANNKAITQIDNAFSGDTSEKNANSIGYLAMAIKAIVGSPDICIYMQKDSDKLCSEKEIGGYNYKIDSGSAALTIKKVDKTGNTVSKTKVLTMGDELSSIFSTINIPTGSTTANTLNTNEKYTFIKDLSTEAKPYIYSHVILINTVEAFESTKKTNLLSANNLLSSLTDILDKINSKTDEAYTRCHCYHIFGVKVCVPWQRFATHSGCSGATVSDTDKSKVNNWASELKSSLSSSASSGVSSSELMALFTSSLDSNNIIDILNDDVTNSVTACETFISNLIELSNTYNLPMNDLGLTETSSEYTLTKGGQTCTASK